MRVTHGEFVRRFVYGLRVGDVPAVKAMQAGRQVWPSNELRVKRVALDMGLLSEVDMDYWRHSLDAVLGGAHAGRYCGFEVNGREYRLGCTYGGFPLARYAMGWLDFGDDGPLAEDVRVGDVLEVKARVDAREGEWFMKVDNAVCELPWLRGSGLEVKWGKGKKKVRAGCEFEVKGVPSGVVHFGGACYTDAHKRGLYKRKLPGNTHKWKNAVHNDRRVAGDGVMSVRVQPMDMWTSTTSAAVRLLWPQFVRVFKFVVTAVEL